MHRPHSHRGSSRPAVHQAPRSANSRSGAVVGLLFEQIARMPWRNLLEDAPLRQFIRNFGARPLADGSLCLHRRFTGEGRYLTTSSFVNLGGVPGRDILQALCVAFHFHILLLTISSGFYSSLRQYH